jgi:hypothetical protein
VGGWGTVVEEGPVLGIVPDGEVEAFVPGIVEGVPPEAVGIALSTSERSFGLSHPKEDDSVARATNV